MEVRTSSTFPSVESAVCPEACVCEGLVQLSKVQHRWERTSARDPPGRVVSKRPKKSTYFPRLDRDGVHGLSCPLTGAPSLVRVGHNVPWAGQPSLLSFSITKSFRTLLDRWDKSTPLPLSVTATDSTYFTIRTIPSCRIPVPLRSSAHGSKAGTRERG